MPIIVDSEDFIVVGRIPITSRMCESPVSDNVCRDHMRRRVPNPTLCLAFAKCEVGDKLMCYKHAQRYVLDSLMNGDFKLVRSNKS